MDNNIKRAADEFDRFVDELIAEQDQSIIDSVIDDLNVASEADDE